MLRPEFVVFYAWQSDRPGSHTRYLIQEAAAEAANQINAEASSSYTVRIDQDTQGVPGLCDIPATILQKIDAADGFLCDLTYIATTQAETGGDENFEARFVSNPNVLFELGYAFRSMGFERLICVMNEHYGPPTEQIFDLAHRRFPFTYRMPDKTQSRAAIRSELTVRLANAIRQLFPLGRRAELAKTDRVPEIRAQFEACVRTNTFHGLVRRQGALAVAVIPAAGKRFGPQELREQHLPPPRQTGWNTEIRGNAVLSIGTRNGECCGVAELRNDGIITAADTWVLDPAFHPRKDLIVPSGAIEEAIITSVFRYCKTLRQMEAPLPWYVCVSLLEIQGYCLLATNSEASRRAYSEPDLAVEPLIVRNISEVDTKAKVASFLRPAIDFIWREFGFEGSYYYTTDGAYTQSLLC